MSSLQYIDPSKIVVSVSRGKYEEIISIEFADGTKMRGNDVVDMFAESLPNSYVDFDKKGRGDALNLDLYGFDPVQNVAVVQVRQAFRRAAKHFMQTRKTYVLVGQNEITHEFFRHPIGSGAVRGAINAGRDCAGVVAAAQRWMWGCTEKQLAEALANRGRQGDVLLVRERGIPGDVELESKTGIVAGSHRITSHYNLRKDSNTGRVYAWGPTIEHIKNQHEPAYAHSEHWYSVRVGDEAPAWNFAARYGD